MLLSQECEITNGKGKHLSTRDQVVISNLALPLVAAEARLSADSLTKRATFRQIGARLGTSAGRPAARARVRAWDGQRTRTAAPLSP